MTVPSPSPSAAAVPDTNFHLWEPLPLTHYHHYHNNHHQHHHHQHSLQRPPPPSRKASERSSTRSSLDLVAAGAQSPPPAPQPKRRSLNTASSTLPTAAASTTTTTPTTNTKSTTACIASSSLSSSRPSAAANREHDDPRDEVEARALRRLTRPPKARPPLPPPRSTAATATEPPQLDSEQRTLSAPALPPSAATSTSTTTTPTTTACANAPSLKPYLRRRGRSNSATSLTSSDDGDADISSAANGLYSVNPSAFSSPTASSDRLQTQIRIIESIDQLKHDASLATSRFSQGSATAEDAAAARYNYAKYLVENIRHLEAGQKVYLDEGMGLLKALSREGHADAQFMYASLLITGVPGSQTRHRPDYDQAFPLYLAAAKRGHADACYHAALCYEHGRGTGAPPDPLAAVKKFRKAAIAHHPGAMYRLGMILATGELGQHRNITASVKWLNLSARFATAKHPHALYQLALLHENDPSVLHGHANPETALELLRRAADLGHVLSQVRLGHLYQFGDLGAPVDPGNSIRYYSLAAQKGSAEAMYELSAWHFTGAEDPVDGSVILPPNDQEAYIWARKAAEKGLPQAEYAVGFYTESAVGVPQDMDEALGWYTIAATHGDDHAIARLKGSDPTSPADPEILAAVADVDADSGGVHCDSHAGKMRREGLNRLYTVRAYKRLKNTVLERRNLRKAGGL
ncbi:hypothetical protein HDU86_001691 [Geranomyces michiganensis]|nr:hypothetical protein HDU86_001691 [Geranomyces michiganensis]